MTLSPADRTILETRLRRLLHPAVLQEHRANPFGPYSPELQELLQFLRRSPDPTLPSYVLLARGTPQHWAIGRRAAVRGEPATQVDATTYATRGEAEHAVFLRRLVEHGLLPAAGPDDQAVAGTAVEPLPGLMGYLDTLSVAPGESIALHVHAEMPRWRADFVRLLCADMAPEGPALRETTVADVPPIECEGVRQRTRVGSFVRVDLPDDALDPARGFAMRCYVMPTLPGRGAQAFMSQRDVTGEFGWSLGLNAVGAPSLRSGEMRLDLDEPLVRGCWHLVEAAIDPARLALSCRPVGTRASNRVWIGRGQPQHSTARLDPIRPPSPSLPAASPLLLAAGWLDEDGQPQEQFDGRLERPTLLAVTASPNTSEPQTVLAAWDFAAGIGPNGIARPSHVEDVGPHGWHGRAFNHPTRAVASQRWDGSEVDFRHAPAHYAAAHFHRDDMTDCDWTPQARIAMPADLPSGVYAVRLDPLGSGAARIDRVPLIVRPPRDRATAPLLLILPTNAYLAYANDHVGVDSPRVQTMVRRVLQFDEFDLYRHARREIGASLYEAHPDGTGICHSSWRRPILTMRPEVRTFNGRAWQFTGDMQIVDWLDRTGRAVDVVTDLDLHREGTALLSRYPCVMTGTHPEYPTRQMLDALGDYVDGGGRVVYTGGNGFYWVTGYDPEDEQVIEIRRWGGSEAWRAQPGEQHLSFTGEPGGLWRHRGRAPQKSFGVGFIAAGLNNAGASYRRMPDLDRRAAWVMAGVDEEFGRSGTAGPAAGLEIDAIDPELGTPAGTILLASSGGRHPDDMLEARENYGMTLAAPGGARNPRVRADMVLMPGPEGGGVFATGSIAWAGALAHDEGVGRILSNVLDRFCGGKSLLD